MRARNTKPGFWQNEAIGSVSRDARLLLIGMWGLADRRGRLEYRPRKWKSELFPHDTDIEAATIPEWLEELQVAQDDTGERILFVYVHDGATLIQICNFEKHQRPHPSEAESVLAEYLGDPRGVPRCEQDVPRYSAHGLDPGSGIRDPDTLDPDEEGSDGGEPDITSRLCLNYPCKGDKEWALTVDKAAEYRALHGGAIAVDHELRKARQWLIDNPDKQKTPRGMTRYLNSWLSRAAEQKADKRNEGEKESFGYG